MGFRVPPSAQSSRRSDSTLRSPFFDASCYGHRTHVGRTTTGLGSGLNLPGSSGPLTAFLSAIGRLGGDEFLIVLEPGTNENTLQTIAQRLMVKCCEPVDLGVYNVSVGASVGAAIASVPSSAADLMVKADLAVYHAKRSEGSPVVTRR